MLIAIVDFEVKPADRATALTVLLEETETVRAMTGCTRFRPFTDPQSRTHVGILHEWSDAAGFAAYLASPGFARAGEALRPMMTAPPSSRRYHADLIEDAA